MSEYRVRVTVEHPRPKDISYLFKNLDYEKLLQP